MIIIRFTWIGHGSRFCVSIRVKLIYGNNRNYGADAAVNIVGGVNGWAAVPCLHLSLYSLKRLVVFPKVS